MAIDVGEACEDRGSTLSTGHTVVAKDNPANATGTIDSVCIYATGSGWQLMDDLEFASFAASGDDLTTNGNVAVANQTSQEQTYTAPGDFTAFNINSGEYIGYYCSGGQMERDTSGYAGVWHVADTDHIPCSGVTFDDFSGDAVSIFATGTEAGGISIPVIMQQMNQFNGGQPIL